VLRSATAPASAPTPIAAIGAPIITTATVAPAAPLKAALTDPEGMGRKSFSSFTRIYLSKGIGGFNPFIKLSSLYFNVTSLVIMFLEENNMWIPCRILIATPTETFTWDSAILPCSITAKDEKGNIIAVFNINSEGRVILGKSTTKPKRVDDKDGRIKALIDSL